MFLKDAITRKRFFAGALFLGLVAAVAPVSKVVLKQCPTTEDLEYGIVYASPTKGEDLHRIYRHLEGPYFGKEYLDAEFARASMSAVSYSGLFTYKAWHKGDLVHHEEPDTDTTQLLKFEPGTSHVFKSTRILPSRSSDVFAIDVVYRIEATKNVRFGLCFYDAVRIRRDGKLTLPGGEIREDHQDFVFIPELKLRMTPGYPHSGPVRDVRIRSETDGSHWPFDENPAKLLHN